MKRASFRHFTTLCQLVLWNRRACASGLFSSPNWDPFIADGLFPGENSRRSTARGIARDLIFRRREVGSRCHTATRFCDLVHRRGLRRSCARCRACTPSAQRAVLVCERAATQCAWRATLRGTGCRSVQLSSQVHCQRTTSHAATADLDKQRIEVFRNVLRRVPQLVLMTLQNTTRSAAMTKLPLVQRPVSDEGRPPMASPCEIADGTRRYALLAHPPSCGLPLRPRAWGRSGAHQPAP